MEGGAFEFKQAGEAFKSTEQNPSILSQKAEIYLAMFCFDVIHMLTICHFLQVLSMLE